MLWDGKDMVYNVLIVVKPPGQVSQPSVSVAVMILVVYTVVSGACKVTGLAVNPEEVCAVLLVGQELHGLVSTVV